MSQELQLSATNHAAAETHYHAVREWLAAKGSPLYEAAPVIYPQGSFRIGATIHPIATNEHDLGFVCEMNIDWKRTLALDVLDAVEVRLRAQGTYAPMVERLKRCIRLAGLELAGRVRPCYILAVIGGSASGSVNMSSRPTART